MNLLKKERVVESFVWSVGSCRQDHDSQYWRMIQEDWERFLMKSILYIFAKQYAMLTSILRFHGGASLGF